MYKLDPCYACGSCTGEAWMFFEDMGTQKRDAIRGYNEVARAPYSDEIRGAP